MELAGIHNILTKSLGTSNPHNVVKATMSGLVNLLDAYTISRRKGIPISKVYL